MTREHLAHNARLRAEAPILAGWGHFYLAPGRMPKHRPFGAARAVSARLAAFWHSTVAPL